MCKNIPYPCFTEQMYQCVSILSEYYQPTIILLLTHSEVSNFFTAAVAEGATDPAKKERAIEAENFIIIVSIKLKDFVIVVCDVLWTLLDLYSAPYIKRAYADVLHVCRIKRPIGLPD